MRRKSQKRQEGRPDFDEAEECTEHQYTLIGAAGTGGEGVGRGPAIRVTRSGREGKQEGCPVGASTFYVREGDFCLLRAPVESELEEWAGAPESSATSTNTSDLSSPTSLLQRLSEWRRHWVAQVVRIHRTSVGQGIRILVKWFYRPEDLYHWHESAGACELFESEHFDENDGECIVGRCEVLDEAAWCRRWAEALREPQGVQQPFYRCRERYDFSTGRFSAARWQQPPPRKRERRSGRVGEAVDESDDVSHGGSDVAAIDAESDSDAGERQRRPGTDTDAPWRPPTVRRVQRQHTHSAFTRRGRRRATSASRVGRDGAAMQFPAPQTVPRRRPSSFTADTSPALPCRENELHTVRSFLESALRGAGARAMYISGVPGTGKTAVVKQVLHQMEQLRDAGKLPHFHFVEINGMALAEPAGAYTLLYEALRGQSAQSGASGSAISPDGVAPTAAAQALDRRFRHAGVGSSTAPTSTTFVLLDEMDAMLTSAAAPAASQKVLYDFLDWPTRPHSGLAVIGIANTLDLPERLLPRIASRLGMNRLTFRPYDKDQLRTILQCRLGELHSGDEAPPLPPFHPDAIELCARKVAAISGDVRRALSICQLARDAVLRAHASSKTALGTSAPRVVTARDIDAAVAEMAATGTAQAIAQCSDVEKALLASAALCSRHATASSAGDFVWQQLLHRYTAAMQRLTDTADALPQNAWRVQQVLARLLSTNLLSETCLPLAAGLSSARPRAACHAADRTYALNVPFDDVVFALRDTALIDMLSV